MKHLLIPAAALASLAVAGFAVTQTPNWKHSMIRQEHSDCHQKSTNLQKAGRAIEAFVLMIDCDNAYQQQMAENFGTTKPSEAPTPIW